MMLLIILGIIIFITICAIIFFIIIKKRYIRYLIDNSIALKNLIILNSKYRFHTLKNFDDNHTYDNEIFFDNISCEDYLIYQLQFKKYDIEKEIKIMNYNKEQYNLYCQELSNINKFGKYIQINKKLNTSYLLKVEKKLFKEKVLRPKIDFNICIVLYCSKINGEVYLRKDKTFSSNEILLLIKRLNDKNREFYNDKEIWRAICRVERGKVSNKMRFEIYKRDGYRCCICGRSEYSDYLEIDHIKPIAKGGKSTYNNLQTLCRRCNKEKGDKY